MDNNSCNLHITCYPDTQVYTQRLHIQGDKKDWFCSWSRYERMDNNNSCNLHITCYPDTQVYS